MKTLENQTLLYDEDCPLCSIYTSGFIKTGMLDENGKKPFSKIDDDDLKIIDIRKASNEIALIDNNTKMVLYGIDSLLKVIGNSFPFIEKIAQIRPINYLLKKLYSFISYNRKVIIPNKKTGKSITCIPDFNYKYRIIYITFTIVITALIFSFYSRLISILPNTDFTKELLLIIGQAVFQSLFLVRMNKEIRLNYIGNLITVSLMGALFLIPILFINKLFLLPEIITLVWFGLAVGLMFAEHFRRIKILELPTSLCYTWLFYSIITLLLLSNL